MSTARVREALSASALGACLCFGALRCARDTDPWDQPVAPPRLARASLRAPAPLAYELAPDSRFELVFGTRQRQWRGFVPLASGRVWVDAHALSATRATLTFDLAALEVRGDAASSPSAASVAAASTLTEQSLNWLELGPKALAAHPERRYARLVLLSVGSVSHEDAADAPAIVSRAGMSARRVRLRAGGELELHGFRLPSTASVEVTLEWAEPVTPGIPPRRVEFRTLEPVGIDLLAHGVVPRDARGDVSADGLAALRKLPGKPVRVEAHGVAELATEPTSAPAD